MAHVISACKSEININIIALKYIDASNGTLALSHQTFGTEEKILVKISVYTFNCIAEYENIYIKYKYICIIDCANIHIWNK